jgi:hypothetical protein
MPVAPFLALLLLAGLPLAAAAQKPNRPAKKAEKTFEPGKPAFSPSPDTPAFDPAKVTHDHLQPEHFQVPEGLEVTVWATSPQVFTYHTTLRSSFRHGGV